MGQPHPTKPRTNESDASRQRSPSKTKRRLSWDEYEELVLRLAMKIDSLKWDRLDDEEPRHWAPEKILGIPRNGLVIASMLGHALGIPDVVSGFDSILSPTQKILLVDDLSDTGDSFERWTKGFQQDGQNYITASLFCKPWSRFKPVLYVEETEDWICFPWEEPRWALLEGKS